MTSKYNLKTDELTLLIDKYNLKRDNLSKDTIKEMILYLNIKKPEEL